MKKQGFWVMVLLLVVTVFVGSSVGQVFVAPVDIQTQSNWRTAAAGEMDGEYGTDGYVMYGLNSANDIWTQPYDTSLANPNTAVSLPSYIGDITLAANNSGMWSGNGNFGQIEDPGAGNALSSTSLLAHGAAPYVFTVTRATSEAFRLTVVLSTGDGVVNLSRTITVDAGASGSATSVDPGVDFVPAITYHSFDITAGADPIIVSITDFGGPAFSTSGFAFDAFSAPPAFGPDPANDPDGTGAKVAVDGVVLSWNAGLDPDNPSQANPAIKKHYLFGNFDNPADLSEPNMALIAEIDGGTTTYGPLTLERDQMYIWRIEEGLDDGMGGALPPGDPNNLVGAVWTFYSALSIPEIDAANPADQLVNEGQEAVFAVNAINPFTTDTTGLTYQWYKNGEALAGETADVLVVSEASESDEGEYFCEVTITATGAISDSPVAILSLKKLIGHWPLDGDPNDASGNDYDGVEIPTSGEMAYAEGIVGTGAVDLDGLADYINCGNVPVMGSGAMTVSFWAKPRNPALAWKGIIAKWDVDTGDTFWIGQHATAGMLNFSIYLPTETRNTPAGVFQTDVWVNVVCSYDGHIQRTFVNGLLVTPETDLNAPLPNYGGDLLIGQVPAGANWFDGLVDDVRVYNYALSVEEAADLYIDVMGPICLSPPVNDLNDDCRVNLADLAIIADEWLYCGEYPTCITEVR